MKKLDKKVLKKSISKANKQRKSKLDRSSAFVWGEGEIVFEKKKSS